MTVAELTGLEPEMKKQALNSKFIKSLFTAGRAAKRGAQFAGDKRNWGLENYRNFLGARNNFAQDLEELGLKYLDSKGPALKSLALHSGAGGGVLGAGAGIKDWLNTTPEEVRKEFLEYRERMQKQREHMRKVIRKMKKDLR